VNIHTYGCSWSYGVHNITPDVTSWPEKLAELCPDDHIWDWSFPGTSMEYSIYQLYRNLETQEPGDIHIFQATMPYRFTYWQDQCFTREDLRLSKTDNYSKYNPLMRKLLTRYHPQTDNTVTEQSLINPDLGYHSKLYSNNNRELELSTYMAQLLWANSVTDVCFTWINPGVKHHLIRDIPCIENILGEDFGSYVHDPGKHFNSEGCDRVAEWVHKRIYPDS